MRKILLILLVAATVALPATIVVPDVAFSHVRDRDKHRMCNGVRKDMKHFHDGTWAPGDGYYFHTQLRHRHGRYADFETWKWDPLALQSYHHAWHTINCRKW